MRTYKVFSMLFGLVLVPSAALAQAEAPAESSPVGVAPSNAFELTIGSGFSRGFGDGAVEGTGLDDLGGLGPSLQLGFGYRIDPKFMVGGYVEGARYSASSALPDGTKSYSGAFGVQGVYHFRPFSRIDPWIGLGTGFRGYWVDRPGSNETMQGWEIARLRIGADYRLTPSASLGPVIGGSLTRFTITEQPNSTSSQDVEDPGMSGFVFVGIQGRFDIGGSHVKQSDTQVASR